MGFNLKMFFEELLELLNSGDLSSTEKLNELNIVIREQYEYAKECGNLRAEGPRSHE